MASEQEIKNILEKAEKELNEKRKLDYDGCECALRNQDGKGPCNFHVSMDYIEMIVNKGKDVLKMGLEEFHATAPDYIKRYSHILQN